MVVGAPDDLVAAVSGDRRMSGYRVRRQGEGWIELEVIAQRARSPVMLVLAWPETWRDTAAFAPHLTRARSGNYGLILVGTPEELEEAKLDTVSTDADLTALSAPITMVQLLLALRSRADAIAMRITAATIALEHERARHENEMLISIGRALSQERDIESLLAIILRRACEVTSSDAGSVYIVEGHEEDLTRRRLRFTVSQNESRNVQSAGFTMPVASSSIVGSCVLSGVPINVPDLYKLDEPGAGNNQWGFVHDRSFDEKYHYQGRSVLAVPMISARDEVIGVIQLINKRGKGFISLQDPSDFEHGVVAFDDVSEKYVSALASQAGIALENVLLYEEVRTLFDSFVKASVTAIESRDPTTSGHSNRVAELTVGLGKAMNRTDNRTKNGNVKGKVAYLAPEQIMGGIADKRVDVFAGALSMYELLTNLNPNHAKTDYETLNNITARDVPDIRSYRPELPDCIARIVHKGLGRSVEQRYQDCGEIVTDLRRAASELKIIVSHNTVSAYLKEKAVLFDRYSTDLSEGSGGSDISGRTLYLSRTKTGSLPRLLGKNPNNPDIQANPAPPLDGPEISYAELSDPSIVKGDHAVTLDMSGLGGIAAADIIEIHSRRWPWVLASAASLVGAICLTFFFGGSPKLSAPAHLAIDSPAEGSVAIETQPPGAQILISQPDVSGFVLLSGTTPLSSVTVTSEVTYDYKVIMSGYRPVRGTFHVAKSDHRTVRIELHRE